MYGVILAEELQWSEVPSILGIDQKNVKVKIIKNMAAVITPVDALHYSQQQIDQQLKDAEWLKEKAFHHHDLIAEIDELMSILPMPFCTIFQSEENLESLLTQQYDILFEKLSYLAGKKEWNLKLFCDAEKALAYVFKNNSAIVDLKEKLALMPKGKQFLMKKKLDQLLLSEFELEQSRWWKEITKQLETIVSEVNLRQNWGKEVTERKDEMTLNCDFLIKQSMTAQFLTRIEEIEQKFESLGCTFQVTGPWPPYHFSKMIKETS